MRSCLVCGPYRDVVRRMVKEQIAAREIDELEDLWPNWRDIVGAVSGGRRSDPDHPFRKWLSTKDPAYQALINGTLSSRVILRSIRLFQSESVGA